MINKPEIISVHAKLDKDLEEHVNKKISQLDRYVPRKSRESLQITVRLKNDNNKEKSHYKCEVVMQLPHEIIDVSAVGVTMFSAVDMVETKLKQQLAKYKELHTDPRFYRRLFSRASR
ncbi:MAG TPA: ribosome-associated translation inhibitor RaiA [Candidatus Binatia bacterium]|nr:ribosome-associated translation inhibitor RaiA [Candidatus Binatia bacterium]